MNLHQDLDAQFRRLNVIAYGSCEDIYCTNAALDDDTDHEIEDLTEPQMKAVVQWLEGFADEAEWANWWALVGTNCGRGPNDCPYCLAPDDPEVIAAAKAHPPVAVTPC